MFVEDDSMDDISLNSFKIASVGRQPLNVRVYDNLKISIINGDISPGTKLSETHTAKMMNVSATPVREAFRRLAAEGLVKSVPWKGVIVQSFTESEMLEAYQCREALEMVAAGLAAENIDEKGIKELYSLLEQSEKAESVSKLVEINSKIHNLIIDYAKNNKLKITLDLFSDIIYRDRNISAYNMERLTCIYKEHKKIIEALEKRDKKLAEETMRKHIKNGLKYILNKK
jgi:DNA-binding GntR family transcriptional regulator